MEIYLNFDGVLHPNQVLYEDGCTPALLTPEHRAFEHADLLNATLSSHDDVKIVLNTWWTFYLGLDNCKDMLPKALAARIVGSTIQHASAYAGMPSRQWEAEKHIAREQNRRCVVLDHSIARYRRALTPALLLVDLYEGLGNQSALRSLIRRLQLFERSDCCRAKYI